MRVTETIGATTKYIPATNTRGARVRVTMAGKSKVVAYDYMCISGNSEHVKAIYDAFDRSDMIRGGTIEKVEYVADSESGKGSVYLVTFYFTVEG